MKLRHVTILALLVVCATLFGCVGYFHYHPIKSTEESRAKEAGAAELFSTETMGAPMAPALSAEPISDDSIIK